jgi:sugar phosphate isomerase/epimerase
MKTAIVVSASPTSFEALALSSDLGRAFDQAKQNDFDAVEIAVRDPALVKAPELLRLARENGLALAAIGTGQAYVEEGLSLTSPDPELRKGALKRMKSQLELSAQLGARVIVGLIRGTVKAKSDSAQALEILGESLIALGDHCAKVGSPGLLIEPINRYETRLLNSVAETSSFLDRLSDPPIKVLADTFHMNIEDRDLAESIKLAGPRLGHVHFADSNRWAPGQGHLDFNPVFEALEQVRYEGYLSAEILPEPSPEEAVRLTGDFFRVRR